MSSAINYIYDNFVRKKVAIVPGAIVCCKLRFDFEHTGVYVGENKIVELAANGYIEKLSPLDFIYKSLYREGFVIYTACDDKGNCLHRPAIAERALSMIGKKRNYHPLHDNCHQFTAGCITGKFENKNNFFSHLEKIVTDKLNKEREIQWIPCDL